MKMKRPLILLSLLIVPFVSVAQDIEGLVKKASPYSVGETMDRLESVLESKGMPFTLRLDHGKSARGAGIDMRDTEILIFGNPKLGSHLMTASQTAGIDLPMKALAWEDAEGRVWLGYNDPAHIASRHGIQDREEVLKKMAGALDKLTNAALTEDQ